MASPGPPGLRILIDVDVVLDVLARREPFFASSAAVLAACETGRCVGLVAAHTVTTLFYLLSKYHDSRFARTQVADLLTIVEVAAVDGSVIRQGLAAQVEESVRTYGKYSKQGRVRGHPQSGSLRGRPGSRPDAGGVLAVAHSSRIRSPGPQPTPRPSPIGGNKDETGKLATSRRTSPSSTSHSRART